MPVLEERCNLCFGRGYRPEVRRSGRGIYLRACQRCCGTGSVEAGSRNPDTYSEKSGTSYKPVEEITMPMDTEFMSSFGEVPDGHFAIAVMGRSGDTKTIWDPNNPDEVEVARMQFEKLVGDKRYSAFRVDSADPNKKGERLTTFDPAAGRTIFIPQMAGGS